MPMLKCCESATGCGGDFPMLFECDGCGKLYCENDHLNYSREGTFCWGCGTESDCEGQSVLPLEVTPS